MSQPAITTRESSASPAKPASLAYGWYIVLVLTAVYMLSFVDRQILGLLVQPIKRDLGIKDWSNAFPGHGGLLDRFNSLLFAAPAAFHYIGYVQGIGLDQPKRLFF